MQRVCVQAKTQGIARSCRELVAAAGLRTPGGARAQVEERELVERGERAEEAGERLVLPHDGAIVGMGHARHELDRLAGPVRRFAHHAVRERGQQRPGEGSLEVSSCEAREPVLERDRLPLLRELEAATDRVRRLREDRGVRRTAAATGAAAAAVEDRQLDVSLAGDPGERLLRSEDLPLRGDDPAVLAGVRVPDHHLEPLTRGAVEQLLDERGRPPQVVDRLEKRHDLDVEADLGGERLGGEDVVRAPRHRDDQGVDAAAPSAPLERSGLGEQRLRVLALLGERARVEPQVEGGTVQAEDVEPPAKVGEPTVGDPLAAVAAEARLDELELRTELVRVRVGVRSETLPDRSQPPAVRLGRVCLLREVDVGHRRIRTDQRARHAPRRCERPDVALEELAHERRATLDGLAHGGRSDVRVPVPVASDPGAEPEWRARQPRLPDGLQLGGGVPQAVLEEPEPLTDLVDDAGPVRAHLVRLPEDRHLLDEPIADRGSLPRRRARIVELREQLFDAAVLLEDGARKRLRRMGGEDELDRHPPGCLDELVLADARTDEQGERLVQRLAQHSALALDLAPAPHSVVLLRDVREVEVHRERAQDHGLRRDGERSDRRCERARGSCVAVATSTCETADLLLQPVRLVAFLLDEHPTERVSEQADVRPERPVERLLRGAAHRPTLPRALRGGAVALLGPSPRLRGLDVAVARRRVRDEVVEQVRGDVRDLVDGAGEDGFVGLRRLRRAADLAHVLERRRADLVVRRARLEVVERSDVPAHGFSSRGQRQPAASASASQTWCMARAGARRFDRRSTTCE